MAKSITNPVPKTDTLVDWQDKYKDAVTRYEKILMEIEDNREAYLGTRPIKSADGSNADKQTSTTRKVVFELIETQVDTNIPLPKVTSKDGLEDQALTIEMFLKNEVERLPIDDINDEQGRTTPTDGGAITFVEWDISKGGRSKSGELVIKNLDSKQVTPQPGVYKLDEMDYLFITFKQTRNKILEKYDVWIEVEDGDAAENEDLLEHVFCFYRNEYGGIGLYSYVGDTEVQDFENYYARQVLKCKKCDTIKNPDTEKCHECGHEKFKREVLETEKIFIPQYEVDPMSAERVFVGEEEVEVPFYIPDMFPIAIRKNISYNDRFLGLSDVSFIKDQQNELSIYSAKIREKLLKSGSILTKPTNVNFKANNDELKIIDVENPQQMAMIEVKNLQPDVSRDLNMLETNYTIARQTLGITDSYQGRQDSTATSGKAKEIAAAQAAGRLSSKRKMKDSAFGRMYEIMFKFLLAYADEPRLYSEVDDSGNMLYKVFDRRDFLLQDSAGDWYYNDDFIFTTDVSSTLSNNREAMWQETRMNFTSGAYGNPVELGTLVMFWQMMHTLHYPGAKQALKQLEKRQADAEKIRREELAAQEVGNRHLENVEINAKKNQIDSEGQVNQMKMQMQNQQQNSGGLM